MRSSCRDTKNRKLYSVIVLLLTICVFLCGCTQTERQNKVRVSIVDSVLFKAENTVAEIERGRDFKTVLSLRAGYEFVSCDYSDYTATEKGGKTELTLKNIERPSRVTVTCRKKEFQNVVDIDLKCTVNYDFNGGTDAEGRTHCTVNYSLTEHHRPNTIAGADVKRRGHVLTGWNTRPDGNGEHIGLGSRVTVRDGKEITLYAEWKKSIDGGQFLYRQAADGTLALTGYRGRGDIEPFVIPSEIDGKAVSEISSSFTTNMPCGELTSQTLVLPDSIRFVKSNSFLRSSFSELYFSDNIEDIDEKAFPRNIKTFHINAFRKPCFQAVNNSIIFSDNIDRLILNADRRKLIFFLGVQLCLRTEQRHYRRSLRRRVRSIQYGRKRGYKRRVSDGDPARLYGRGRCVYPCARGDERESADVRLFRQRQYVYHDGRQLRSACPCRFFR